jgi:hypothetical protein
MSTAPAHAYPKALALAMPNEKGMANDSNANVMASALLRIKRLKSSSRPAANIR